MNNPLEDKDSSDTGERNVFPFVIEFIKFSIVFVIIVAAALFLLHLLNG